MPLDAQHIVQQGQLTLPPPLELQSAEITLAVVKEAQVALLMVPVRLLPSMPNSLSRVMAEKSGTGPDKELWLNRRTCKSTNSSSRDGMVPLIIFIFRSKTWILNIPPSCVGMAPVRALPATEKERMADKYSSPFAGKGPVSWFWSTLKISRLVTFERS